MKIAYITEINLAVVSGVCKKLQEQVAGWEKMRHEVMVYSLAGTDDHPGNKLPANATGLQSRIYTLNVPFLKRNANNFLNKVFSGYKLKKELRHFSPDVVYYAQGMWFPALDGILERYPTVMEVNTVDTEVYAFSRYLKRQIYFFGKSRIMKRLKGIVCVTEEISRKYWQYNIPRVVVSNGIDLSSVNGEATLKEIKEKPQLIFVGSTGRGWHGLDKIFLLAKHLPQFDFHLVGKNLKQPAPLENVHLHGSLSTEELQRLYGSIDVGIGTLALYRMNMEEASPLKVRDYCRHGLPVIGAYYDSDLAGKDYMLRLENREDNIMPNLEKIRDFVVQWKGRRINPVNLRAFLDTTVKETVRINFLQQIVAINTPENDR